MFVWFEETFRHSMRHFDTTIKERFFTNSIMNLRISLKFNLHIIFSDYCCLNLPGLFPHFNQNINKFITYICLLLSHRDNTNYHKETILLSYLKCANP